MDRKGKGDLGEKLAAGYLKKRGYKILDRNYRCREGELDIVARKGDCLVFVEVRTKSGNAFGTPEESVTATKRRHIAQAAFTYLQEHGHDQDNWRIDLVAVELDQKNKPQRIELIENAMDW